MPLHGVQIRPVVERQHLQLLPRYRRTRRQRLEDRRARRHQRDRRMRLCRSHSQRLRNHVDQLVIGEIVRPPDVHRTRLQRLPIQALCDAPRHVVHPDGLEHRRPVSNDRHERKRLHQRGQLVDELVSLAKAHRKADDRVRNPAPDDLLLPHPPRVQVAHCGIGRRPDRAGAYDAPDASLLRGR